MQSSYGISIILAISLLVTGCQKYRDGDIAYPAKPIKIIVPFGAGGGTDTFARTLQKTIEDRSLLPQPIVIINVPGASGTLGSRRALNARPDGYTLLCLHEAILTAKFSGKVNYGPEMFDPIAGTGASPLVICVGAQSPYESLHDLMQAAADSPESIVFSASIGAPSQYAGLFLEKEMPGARFRYTQTGGGAKRFAAIKGGHVDVSAFSLAEYSQFRSAGLRALAICSQKRHEFAPDVPTAVEQGFDCISENMQFWWAPKGTDKARIAIFAEAVSRAMKDPEVIERLRAACTDPDFLNSKEVQEDMKIREARLASVSMREVLDLPNFPLIIGIAITLLGLAAVFQSDFGKSSSVPTPVEKVRRTRIWFALGSCVLVVMYVVAMDFRWVEFRVATISFMIAFCGLLLKLEDLPLTKRLLGFGAFAVVFSIGLHALFTRVLVLDLP